ncbi:hypothetical protein QTP88_014274 [Uroleucon formosanum]
MVCVQAIDGQPRTAAVASKRLGNTTDIGHVLRVVLARVYPSLSDRQSLSCALPNVYLPGPCSGIIPSSQLLTSITRVASFSSYKCVYRRRSGDTHRRHHGTDGESQIRHLSDDCPAGPVGKLFAFCKILFLHQSAQQRFVDRVNAGLDKAGKGATHHGAGGPPHGVKFFAEMAAVLRAPCIRSHELRLFQQLYYNDDDDNNN